MIIINSPLSIKTKAMLHAALKKNPIESVAFLPILSSTNTAVKKPGISIAQVRIKFKYMVSDRLVELIDSP